MGEGYNPKRRCKCGNGWEMHGGRCQKCKRIEIKKKKVAGRRTKPKSKKGVSTRSKRASFPK